MPGEKEKLAELQKQKSDIEMLLSSLEEAYNEASLSEEHYKEVKGKNQKKLDEINSEIANLEEKLGKAEPAEEPKPAEPAAKEPQKALDVKPKKKKGKKPKAAEKRSKKEPAEEKPKKKEAVDDDLPIIPVSQPGPGEGLDTETPSVPPAETASPQTSPVPSKISKDIAAVGTSVGTDDIKNIITKLVNEIRPAGIEVLPRVEKMQVQLEKLKSFIEAVKDEKKGDSETVRRIMEEMGELRSNVASADGRLSDTTMKVDDIKETLKSLEPARFTKLLTRLDAGIKENEAKIEKLDEVTSVVIKKIGLIEDVLREMGSLEKVVDFSKNIASRMIQVDETEKRITRVGDKINGIFMELNKRLEDFMLYKAKQDTSDELIQEMMKSIDEMTTKVSGLVTKEEMEEMRETLETKLSSVSAGTGASPKLLEYQEQKDEINSVLEMMEEQLKSGALKKEDYEKAKNANLDRLKEIEQRIAEERTKPAEMTGAPAPATEPREATESPEPGSENPPSEVSQTPESEKPEEGEASGKVEAPPEKTDGKKEKSHGEKGVADKEKPEPKEKTKKEEKIPEKKKEPRDKPELSKKERMLKDLEDSLSIGLISKAAYEKVKKMLGG